MKIPSSPLLLAVLLSGCGPQPDDRQTGASSSPGAAPRPSREIAMTINLKDDSTAIAQYKQYHRRPWPEIEKANRAAGIEKVRIYLQGRRLVMILTVPPDWDQAKADAAYAGAGPRVKEWGALMEGFQEPLPEAGPGESWLPMESVYSYDR